jgi:hypothetical protein
MAVERLIARDEVYEFLASGPTPAEIVAFHPSDVTQTRMQALLEKNQTGMLSEAERAELDENVRLEDMMRALKSKARRHIQP